MIEWKYLSPEEQQKWLDSWEPNGCWAKGGWFKPPYHIFFEASCNIHDYWYKYWENEDDRLQADLWLLKYMCEDVRKLKWYKQPKMYIWCILYYFALRIFWKKAFYKNKLLSMKKEKDILQFEEFLKNNSTAIDGDIDEKAIFFGEIASDVLLADSVLLSDGHVLNQWPTNWCVAVGTTDWVNNGLATVWLEAGKKFIDLVNYIREKLDDQIDERGTWIKNWPTGARKLWWIKWFSYLDGIQDIKKALTYWLSVESGTNKLSWWATRKNNYIAVLGTGWGHHMNICWYEENKTIVWSDGREYTGYFIIENSWGDQWGDAWYYYLPFEYADDVLFNTKISMVVDKVKNTEFAKDMLKKLEDQIENKNITSEKEIILNNIEFDLAKEFFERWYTNWKNPKDPLSRQEFWLVMEKVLRENNLK